MLELLGFGSVGTVQFFLATVQCCASTRRNNISWLRKFPLGKREIKQKHVFLKELRPKTGAKGWWDVRRGGEESRGIWPSILLWDALPIAVWNGIASVQPGILPEKCISHMSEVCGVTIAIIYPFPEYCWSIPMFYLYGEIAWCTTVSSLLQAVLFQLYSGEFAYYGLLLQTFELRKYCDLTNTFCLLPCFFLWGSEDSFFLLCAL